MLKIRYDWLGPGVAESPRSRSGGCRGAFVGRLRAGFWFTFVRSITNRWKIEDHLVVIDDDGARQITRSFGNFGRNRKKEDSGQ